jgi:hypothetical protein
MQASAIWRKPDYPRFHTFIRPGITGAVFFALPYGIGLYMFFPPHIQYDVLKYNNSHAKGE